MSEVILRSLLAIAAGAALITWPVAWRVPGPVTVARSTQTEADPIQNGGGVAGGGGLLKLARGTTPFRLDRRPPRLRYGASPPAPGPIQPAVPRPKLVLSGILWGREPAAILEGVPGQEAPVVVHVGDSAGPLRITRIEPVRVFVRGLDTSWVLTVRETWQ